MPEIKYKQLGSSLVNLPPSIYSQLVTKGSRPQSLAVILRLEDREVYLGWSGMASSIATLAIEDYVEIDPVVATAYRLQQGANVSISLHSSLPVARTVNVIPDTADDWEMLEAHAEYVEQNLLSQVRLASTTQPMVVYLPSKSSMTFRVEGTDPATSSSFSGIPAVRLDRDTDVAFAPKLRRPPPSSASSTIRPTPTPIVHDETVHQLARLMPARVCARTEPGLAYAHPELMQRLGAKHKVTVTLTRVKSPLTRYNDKRSQGKLEENGLTLGMGGSAAMLKNATSKPHQEPQELTVGLVGDEGVVDGHVVIPLGSQQRLQTQSYELVSICTSHSQIQYHDYDILTPLFKVSDDDILPGQCALVDEATDYLISSIGMSLSKLGEQRAADRSLGLLISGGFSTGKTTLAKTIAHHLSQDGRVLANSVYEDVSGWSQEKSATLNDKLRLLVEEASWSAPSVVILDGLESLLTPESEQNSSQSSRQRTLAEFFVRVFSPSACNLPQGVVLIGVASSALHPSLNASHAFGKEIKVLPPAKSTRREILERLFDDYQSADFSKVNTFLIASETEGYLPTDVKSITERAIHHASLHHRGDEVLRIATHHFEASLAHYTPHALRNVNLQSSGVKWTDVGGMRYVKSIIRETLEWPTKYALIFNKCPLRLRSGLLLYGYPGCGKTLIASAVAKECNLNFISVKGPELLNKYIGQSEASTREYFERAKAAKPCVLFFDEFDSIAPRRGHDSTGVTDRVVNQFLTQMDGAEGLDSGVFVLAATSRPDLVDPALLRPGRLDKSLLCDMPDEQERFSILTTLTKSMSLSHDVDLESVAARCRHFSGADLQALVYNAHLECVHDVLSEEAGDEVQDKVEETPKYTWSVHSGEPLTRSDEKEVDARIDKLLSHTSHTSQIQDKQSKEESKEKQSTPQIISVGHIEKAFAITSPSVSADEIARLSRVYQSFTSGRPSTYNNGEVIGSRSSLA